MKILIFGINYSPELTGIGKYTGEMGSWLAQNEHDVHVITAMPYYPEWKVCKKYKGKLWFTEKIDGVTIHRIPLYVPKKVRTSSRIFHEMSFAFAAIPVFFKLSIFFPKFDVIFCINPPFHIGIGAVIYSKLTGVPLITHVQDLQVDAAANLGMIHSKKFLNIMFRMERWILKNSAKVSTIDTGMAQKISQKGIAAEKQILFPNWVDENHIKPLPKEQSLREKFGIEMNNKVVLYSGNIGEKQGLEFLIDVAEKYKNCKDLHFLIVGSGKGKEALKKIVASKQLSQLKFYPLQPYEKLSALLATADVHVVLQKKSAADLLLPSKLTTILAAGGCAVVTAEKGTSLHKIVSTHHIGFLCEPENTAALAATIHDALHSNLDIYRSNARKYAEQYLRKENILRIFENELKQLRRETPIKN